MPLLFFLACQCRSPSVRQYVSLSTHRAVNHNPFRLPSRTNQTRYRSAKIYGSNKIYSAQPKPQPQPESESEPEPQPEPQPRPAPDAAAYLAIGGGREKYCQALRVWPSKCCTPHQPGERSQSVRQSLVETLIAVCDHKCRLHLNFGREAELFVGHVGWEGMREGVA